MLKFLTKNLICPTCKNAAAELNLHVFEEGRGEHVKDGILVCPSCASWYPIEDHVLELLPPNLAYSDDIQKFYDRFTSAINNADIDKVSTKQTTAETNDTPQLTQREHFDWYAENSQQTYDEYESMPFWRAVDHRIIKLWRRIIKPGGVLLDVACGNGRSSFPHISVSTVIGFDIAKKAVKRAYQRAIEENCEDKVTFFVGDAANLPFKDKSFDFVQTYGSLHHFPSPHLVAADLQRVLKTGGIHFGMENNKTVFRRLFDLMMEWLPIWVEEAGDEPLISEEMIRDWVQGCPVSITCGTSTYLPPHLLNLVGLRMARVLLNTSDCMLSLLPWIKHQGGLIYFEIKKLDSD